MDKFEFYDVLGILVPGTLFACAVLTCFPVLASFAPTRNEAINGAAFAALAVFVGQLIQALSSLLEPALFKMWGGRPSDVALASGLGPRYLPESTARRIRSKLESQVGHQATIQDCFLYAMHAATVVESGRVAKFNALYAYHRALLVLVLLVTPVFLASSWYGALATIGLAQRIVALCAAAAVFALLVFRTKQRAMYYVREVLLGAERGLQAQKATT